MRRTKSKLKSHNVFFYIGVYFSIIILIVFVMGGYLYSYLYKTVYSDFLLGNEQHLTTIVNHHENDLQIVDNIVTQIGIAEDVTRFKLQNHTGEFKELKKQLRGYTTVSEFFDLLFYQYHKDEYIYHYNTSISLDLFLYTGCLLENLSPEAFKNLLKAKEMGLRVLPEQGIAGNWIRSYVGGNDRYVIILRAIPPDLEDTLMFMVPDAYYDSLLGNSAIGESKDFLMLDGSIIVSRGSVAIMESEIVELMGQEEMKTWMKEKDFGQREVSVGKERFLLSVREGESGIYYGTLQSLEIFHGKIKIEQWIVLLVILLCIFLAFLIVAMVSKGLIKKVKDLNLLLDEETNYNLTSIENGIQTLVMTQRESEKENLVFKKTRFVRDFIRGDFSDRQTAVFEAHKAKLFIDYANYIIVLQRSREINKENKAYSLMLETIDREEDIEGYGIHLISNNQTLFVLFGDERELIESVLQNMMGIADEYSNDYVIAVSNYHTDFADSSKAYLEADTTFDNHLLMGNKKIIRFSDVPKQDHISLMPENYMQQLKYAIRNSDKKAVEIAVKEICRKINNQNASLYAFRIFYTDLIHILLTEWKGDRIQFDDFYNVFTLSQCLNIDDFHDLIYEVCKVIIDNQNGEVVEKSDIVQAAITYMHENFQNPDLTINALADYLNISSVTLSVEFKNEMDIAPLNYLINLRMEKAKELLRNTNMLIRDVCVAVGYEDERVFTRRFKAYTGMTPRDYRTKVR